MADAEADDMIDFREREREARRIVIPDLPVYRDASGNPVGILAAEHLADGAVRAEIDGMVRTVRPGDPLWPAIAAWEAAGNPVSPFAPPPMVTAAQVKAEAARRLAPTDWKALRAAEGGKALTKAEKAARAAIRAASDLLEAMDPIPADFADDRYWSAQP